MTSQTTTNHPPGIKLGTLQILRLLASGQKFEPLEFFSSIERDYGGLSYHELGPVKMYQITDPEAVREVLVEKADKFHKGSVMKRSLVPFVGYGLVTSDGAFWKRQRKLAQPAFHFKRIEGYAAVMVEHTLRALDGWRDGETRFIDREMMKLTLSIVCKTLFDADVSADAERVAELLAEVLEISNNRLSAVMNPPEWMPTPSRLRMKKLIAELDSIIQRFIDDRRADSSDRGDLLSMLMLSEDENGERMSDKQLRDEVMTLFFAGHETTAMTLTWVFYALSQHPDVLAKVQAETDAALAGRTPTLRDLDKLPYGEMVIKEAMRLYSPVPGVNRQAIEDVEISGYTIAKGTEVSIYMWAMHRSASLYANPLEFDPERFSPENEKQIPRYAYLPFGAGPRVCIGNSFSMMEARLVLAAVAGRFELALYPGHAVEPEQLLTIRPKHGLKMIVKQREPVRQLEAV